MKTKTLKMLAGVGAIALSVAFATKSVMAITIESGDPVTVNVTTTVNNQLDVAVTTLAFGTFGTVTDAAEVATASMTPASAFTEDLLGSGGGGEAQIIDATLGDHLAASVTVAAFDSTMIHVTYTAASVTDLDDDTTGVDELEIVTLTDNLNTVNGGGGDQGGWTRGAGLPGTSDGGYATTTAAGALVFNIGGSFRTQAGVVYPSDGYTGTFDIVLSY